jgi:hypothetical protein
MSDSFIEYAKLHLISLEQDLEEWHSEDDGGYLQTMSAIETTRHLLTVYADMLYNGNLGKEK